VSEHFKEAVKDDPTLVNPDAMAYYMPPAPTSTSVPASYTDPSEFVRDMLPTLVEDMVIIAADIEVIPGQPPEMTMRVLLPKKG